MQGVSGGTQIRTKVYLTLTSAFLPTMDSWLFSGASHSKANWPTRHTLWGSTISPFMSLSMALLFRDLALLGFEVSVTSWWESAEVHWSHDFWCHLDVHVDLVPCLEKVMVYKTVAKKEGREGSDGKEMGEPMVMSFIKHPRHFPQHPQPSFLSIPL